MDSYRRVNSFQPGKHYSAFFELGGKCAIVTSSELTSLLNYLTGGSINSLTRHVPCCMLSELFSN